MPSLWFYHGCLSRQETEQCLAELGKEGAFLVRDSETIPGAFSLCLWTGGKLHQYRIIKNQDDQYFIRAEAGVEERKYSSVDALVEDYMSRKVSNGLAGPLNHPVSKSSSSQNEYELEHSVDNSDPLTQHFSQQLQRMDLSRLDNDFVIQLRQYIDHQLFYDARRVKNGFKENSFAYFKEFVRDSLSSLQREVDYFNLKLSIMQELFCSSKPDRETSHPSREYSLESVLTNCASLPANYSELEHKFTETLTTMLSTEEQDNSSLYSNHNSEDPCITRPLFCQTRRTSAFKHTFAVKRYSGGKMFQKNHTIVMDLKDGYIMIVKPNQQTLGQSTFISHDKILQIIKSLGNVCLLTLKFQDRKNEKFLFDSFENRDLFCQLMTHMKRLFTKEQDPDVLSVFIGTWNMSDDMNSWSIAPWLKSFGEGKSRDPALALIPHDLYVIGTQETAGTEKEWERSVKTCLDHTFSIRYETVHVSSLWGIRLMILCKSEHKHRISNIQNSQVKTGFRNTMGNKGAVGISFQFQATTFCFINAHLTSGSEKNAKREQNYNDIIRNLSLGDRRLNSITDITLQFDHVFFLGDLNFRVDKDIQEILTLLEIKNFKKLLSEDQLLFTRSAGAAFLGFEEEEITFPPTYRYEKGKRSDWSYQKLKPSSTNIRMNVPSWCDRVLYLSRENLFISNTSYGCNLDFTTSDHKPVFSSFQVGIVAEYACLADNGLADNNVTSASRKLQINFDSAVAKLRYGSSKQKYCLQFSGRIIGNDIIRSKANTHFRSVAESVLLHNENQFPDRAISTSNKSLSTAAPNNSICPSGSIPEGHLSSTSSSMSSSGLLPASSASSVGYHRVQQQVLAAVWTENFHTLEIISGVDRRQVEESHLLINVLDVEGRECYGSCVLSLKDLISDRKKSFEKPLIHFGELTGSLLVICHISPSPGSAFPAISWGTRKKKTYDLVLNTRPCMKEDRSYDELDMDESEGEIDEYELTEEDVVENEADPAPVESPDNASAFRPVHPAGVTSSNHSVVKIPVPISPNTLHRFLSDQPKPTPRSCQLPAAPISYLSRSGPPNSSLPSSDLYQNSPMPNPPHSQRIPANIIRPTPVSSHSTNHSQPVSVPVRNHNGTLSVHNQGYLCTSELRGGVPSNIRQLDARVDLSALEANLQKSHPSAPMLPPKRSTVLAATSTYASTDTHRLPLFTANTYNPNNSQPNTPLRNGDDEPPQSSVNSDRCPSLDRTPCRGEDRSTRQTVDELATTPVTPGQISSSDDEAFVREGIEGAPQIHYKVAEIPPQISHMLPAPNCAETAAAPPLSDPSNTADLQSINTTPSGGKSSVKKLFSPKWMMSGGQQIFGTTSRINCGSSSFLVDMKADSAAHHSPAIMPRNKASLPCSTLPRAAGSVSDSDLLPDAASLSCKAHSSGVSPGVPRRPIFSKQNSKKSSDSSTPTDPKPAPKCPPQPPSCATNEHNQSSPPSLPPKSSGVTSPNCQKLNFSSSELNSSSQEKPNSAVLSSNDNVIESWFDDVKPYATAMKINGRVVTELETSYKNHLQARQHQLRQNSEEPSSPENGSSTPVYANRHLFNNVHRSVEDNRTTSPTLNSHFCPVKLDPESPGKENLDEKRFSRYFGLVGEGKQQNHERQLSDTGSGSEVEYITLLRPANLTRWLECLHLSQYVELFLGSKWNVLDVAKNLSDSDLVELGITDEAHRRKIISSLDLI